MGRYILISICRHVNQNVHRLTTEKHNVLSKLEVNVWSAALLQATNDRGHQTQTAVCARRSFGENLSRTRAGHAAQNFSVLNAPGFHTNQIDVQVCGDVRSCLLHNGVGQSCRISHFD
jgi:hypothetical protein